MRLHDLERCVQLLMEHARLRGVDEITFGDSDLYWTVSSPEWMQLYADPKPAVGSSTDDEEELQKMITEEDPSAVDFDRVAHLLRRDPGTRTGAAAAGNTAG